MTTNKCKPHVLILPEDDANRQLANGFVLAIDTRQIQTLTEAGGWHRVCEAFREVHADDMRNYNQRFMVLLIDFDDDLSRRNTVDGTIPPDVKDRVFILGARTEPEDLKRAKLGSYESIGRALAAACCQREGQIWEHALLSHNKSEVERLRSDVCPYLV